MKNRMVEELKKDLISKIDGKNATQEKNNEIEDEELLNFVNKKRNLQQLGAVLNNEGREKLLEVLPSLEKVLENSLDDIYNRINEKNRQNTISNWDYYTKLDGILIQLYANIKYGENLALTGTRLGDDNAKKTNLYMWRFELERRSGMIEYRKIHRLKDFSDLLDIPNLSALLSVVGNQEQQNRVFDKFLNFFLNDVKVNGMFFENQIGNENLTALLNYLILAEIKPTEKVELEGGQKKTRLQMATDLKNQIQKGVSIIVEKNKYQWINQQFSEITNIIGDGNKVLSGTEKQELVSIYTNLFTSLQKTKDFTLNKEILISLSTVFTENEIDKFFGGKVLADVVLARGTVGRELTLYEPINDILAQVDQQTTKEQTNVSEGVGTKWGMTSLKDWGHNLFVAQAKENGKSGTDIYIEDPRNTAGYRAWQAFAATRPQEANAVYKGYRGTMGDYTRSHIGGNVPANYTAHQFIPEQFKIITVPGAQPIFMRIPPEKETQVKNLFNQANSGKITLIMPEYSKEFSKVDQSNQGSSYNYDLLNPEEANKNVLDLSDLAISKTNKDGNILLYKIGEESPYQTIGKEEQQKAKNANQMALMSIQTPEVRDVYEKASEINIKMGDIQKLSQGFIEVFTQGEKTLQEGNGKMSDKQAEAVRNKAKELGDSLNTLRAQETTFKAIKQQLEDMLKNIDKNRLTSNDEMKLKSALEQVNFILEGIGPDGAITQFAEFMSNPKNIKSNDTRWKNVRNRLQDNGIKMLTAIGLAVAAIVVTVGTFGAGSGAGGLLMMGAVGTAGGIVGSRVGQFVNETLWNATIYRDTQYKYDDPIDIELLANGKIEPAEFIKNVGTEFLIGTLTTAAFMGAGQLIGRGLGTRARNATLHGVTRPQNILNKLTFGKFSIGDAYTQQIFENAAKNGIRESALKHFTKEFFQEIFEESYEQAAEELGNALHMPALATLASIYSCLTPGTGGAKIFMDNKIQFNGLSAFKSNGSGATTILELTYNGDINQIQKYYTSLKDGAFTYDASTQTLSRPSTFAKEGKLTETIKLIPSKVSVEIRAMGPTLSSEYGIEIDHENGTLLAFDPKKLAEFEKSIQKNGLGQVVIHPTTGRMQLITGKTTKEVITIKPHPELVKQNAQLDDNARILKAQELLNGEVLTEAQKQAILDAHNQEGTIYNLTPEQKRVRIDILGKAGFTSADIRVLFENGIVGKDYYKTKAEANPHFQETIDIEGIKKYFINKAQNTEGKEKEAYENSKFMCTINTKTTTKNFVQQHTKLKEKLLAEYKRINNLLPEGEKMPFERSELENFTQEQMKSLMDAHEADGKLGELTTGQLKEKVGLLAETVTNEQVRRFLLEGGFSGENGKTVLKNNEKIIYNTTEKIKINNHKNMEVDQYKLLTENVDIETMKTNANFLYFNRSTKIRGEPTAKVKFENAIQTGDIAIVRKLYEEAVRLSIEKFEKIGLTVEENKHLVEYFRTRNIKGIRSILSKIEKKESRVINDTEAHYSRINEQTGERIYDKKSEKMKCKDPFTNKEIELTRSELHDKIIKKFLSDGEKSKGNKILGLTGGMPGAGKGMIEGDFKKRNESFVIVNPDEVKRFLPEYDKGSGVVDGGIVHEESSYLSKIIYNKAIEGGYSILYDSSMKDNPTKNFPKYNNIINVAHNSGYTIEAHFVFDGGEARYRNAVIRDRTVALESYLDYRSGYQTIDYLANDPKVLKVEIRDNSVNNTNAVPSKQKIIYENGQIQKENSDPDLIKRFGEYKNFLEQI